MKFLKSKVVKWIATSVATCALIYVGVPAPVATQVGDVIGERVEDVIE